MHQCDKSIKQLFFWQHRRFFLLCLVSLTNNYTITILGAGVVLCVDSSTRVSQSKMYSVNYPNQYGDNLNCTLTYHFNTTVFPPGSRKYFIFDIQEFSMENGFDQLVVDVQERQYVLTGSLNGTRQCMFSFQYVCMHTCTMYVGGKI